MSSSSGSFGAAQQLSERIQREPDAGMKVIGICLPSSELPRPVVDGIPVLGSLGQVPQVVRTMGCDAVAVTSDDATRYNYLRELAWSLEGAGVELLVDPGLVEVAGPRMHIRPLMGFPLLHVEEPHFTGWRRVVKRAERHRAHLDRPADHFPAHALHRSSHQAPGWWTGDLPPGADRS